MQKNKKPGRGVLALVLAAVVLLGAVAGVVVALRMMDTPESTVPPSSAVQGGTSSSAPTGDDSSTPTGQDARAYEALPLPSEMRAMWISFLEWQQVDFTTEESARAAVATMFENCAHLGLNTVIVAVRPFGDALYESDIFPYSHLLHADGAQGVRPGYDPLAVMVEEAHALGLRIEAWINPYRVQDTRNGPATLSEDNPAALQPALVRNVGGNLWYDPGLPAVQQLVTDGAAEIVRNYDVDGIHFDDYFYPEGADDAFDADSYAQYSDGQTLADWRRENTNSMVWHVYEAVKSANPTASFGISCQGNNENNYGQMYADVRHWMANEGYVDYVMPQLYWGFAYRTAGGREDYAFENISATWAFYPRQPGVRLYAGLGAYRIGAGDGGSNDQSEWQSGHNLADMVENLRTQADYGGFALFRYAFLFENPDALGAQETEALWQVLQAG
ncbi:family 10 glycosylhydrolase [Ruminococcaceae bacterium OttesenSCG-928-O06]|nr:family 10 glycosylhydrolase [Ruminococcaceae bacterium OttesenSCG-928-O06]